MYNYSVFFMERKFHYIPGKVYIERGDILDYGLPNFGFFCAGINYSSLWQPIIIGLVLAIVGVGMEYFILKSGTLWMGVGADFVATVSIGHFLSIYYGMLQSLS